MALCGMSNIRKSDDTYLSSSVTMDNGGGTMGQKQWGQI